jgi:16S rRNA (cytosine967-C5)-methyltransferase
MTLQASSDIVKKAPTQIPLWRQLQSTANVLLAVRSGESGTSALKQVDPNLRPGVQALSFHVWRWLGTAEIIKSTLAKRAPPPQADALLCVALAILCGESAGLHYEAFTLVDQAVEAAKRHPNTNASSSFINACLRRFLREKDALTQKALTHPVGQWNHPQWWIKRLKIDHPNTWQAILKSNNTHAPLSLRVNTKKSSVASYLISYDAINNIANNDVKKDGEFGVSFSKAIPVHEILGFTDGTVSVQDAAAQLAAPLLLSGMNLNSKSRILDACAAPGGKTAHLLEIADCEVVALDIDAARCDLIHQNLNRVGLSAKVIVADAAKPATWFDAQRDDLFDAILLDAPCTASGIVRRHPDIRWLRRETDIAQLAEIQRHLLATLWKLVKPGGRLLYCTCSVFKAEGHDQVALFTSNNKNAKLLSSPGHLIPKNSAKTGVVAHNEQSNEKSIELTNHDGFFYALFEKQST